MYRESSLGLKADFSSEAMEAKWQWDDISKALKEKDYQKRILHSAKLLSKN